MKYYKKVKATAIIALSFIIVSCIQPESPNSEADILTCMVAGDILLSAPQIDNNRVTLRVSPSVDRSKIQLDFTLTPGATITPAGGAVFDLIEPITFEVTSEDKEWTKTYTVTCIFGGIEPGDPDDTTIEYNFDNYRIYTAGSKNYYEFFEINDDGSDKLVWASGNSGYSIVSSGKEPEEYPTLADPNGRTGACLKLETRATGSMGSMVGMPMAAGNLFLGEFKLVGFNALAATHFGEVFNQTPTGLTGYYKYKSGDVYKDKAGNVIPGKKDSFDIYGIFFEADNQVQYLDGTNSLTSPNLISIARIPEDARKETDEWTYFYIPFETLPGKEINLPKLKDYTYKISIVISSSIDGGSFNGAIGSTLYIDQLELIYE